MTQTILLLGASGFIGRHASMELRRRGHDVIHAHRRTRARRRQVGDDQSREIDLAAATPQGWADALRGVDAVINAAGTLRPPFEDVHSRGPKALFEACAKAGTPCVIQISALGPEDSRAAFLTSKREADETLRRLAAEGDRKRWCVARPSLVVGRGGASTALFAGLAAIPTPVGLGRGDWRIQPLHVTDLAVALADMVEQPTLPATADLTGPAAMTTDEFTRLLRRWLGLRDARIAHIPTAMLEAAARAGNLMPGAMLTEETLSMLAGGSVAETHAEAPWTKRIRRIDRALADDPASHADLLAARIAPVLPIATGALAAVWVGSGIASLLLSTAASQALLAGFGLGPTQATVVTVAGALLDVVLGLALLSARTRTPALVAQIATMALYTALATVALPGLWLDPFGSLLKNLAVLAASMLLLAARPGR